MQGLTALMHMLPLCEGRLAQCLMKSAYATLMHFRVRQQSGFRENNANAVWKVGLIAHSVHQSKDLGMHIDSSN